MQIRTRRIENRELVCLLILTPQIMNPWKFQNHLEKTKSIVSLECTGIFSSPYTDPPWKKNINWSLILRAKTWLISYVDGSNCFFQICLRKEGFWFPLLQHFLCFLTFMLYIPDRKFKNISSVPESWLAFHVEGFTLSKIILSKLHHREVSSFLQEQ